jgi:hypothetical protein
MGNYTQLKIKLKFRKDTPQNVVDLFNRVIANNDLGLGDKCVLFDSDDVFKPEIDHQFFTCDRWYMLLTGGNGSDLEDNKFYKDGEYWALFLHTEFKNYDSELKYFLDWITLYVVGRKLKQHIGWCLPDWMNDRTEIFIKRNS